MAFTAKAVRRSDCMLPECRTVHEPQDSGLLLSRAASWGEGREGSVSAGRSLHGGGGLTARLPPLSLAQMMSHLKGMTVVGVKV